jgi:hypothetical protein
MNLKEIIQKSSWLNCNHHVETHPERAAFGPSASHGTLVEVCMGCLVEALERAYKEGNDV